MRHVSYPEKNGFKEIVVQEIFPSSAIPFYLFAFLIWIVGELGTIANAFKVPFLSGPFFSYFLFFLVWQVMGVFLLFTTLWKASGSQAVSLQGSELQAVRSIGLIKYQKKVTYNLNKISNIRLLEGPKQGRDPNPMGNFKIALDYEGKTENLLRYLSREQAEAILDSLLKQVKGG